MNGSAALIVEAVRTPIGRRNGALAPVHPAHLAAGVVAAVIQRGGIEPGQIDDVIMGCVSAVGDQSLNIGRTAALLAGIPPHVPATTVDRQCGSSQQAVNFAAAMIASGANDIVLAAGVESMTRVPMGSSVDGGVGHPFPAALRSRYPMGPMGQAAERIAGRWRITRGAQDAFSLDSHRRAAQATDAGFFDQEIVPVLSDGPGSQPLLSRDEGVRRDAALPALAALTPAFDPAGSVTAGNASQISDGAAAVLLVSERRAVRLGLRPRARVVAHAVLGDDPVLALTAPIPATRAILARAGLRLDQIDLIEFNEAFAAVVLAWAHEVRPDMDRVNVNGGAIALGHPLGASGARLMATLVHELDRRGGRYGLQLMCGFGGLGLATLIERL